MTLIRVPIQQLYGRGRGRGRGGFESSTHKANSKDKSNVECYRCHMYEHYKFECHTNLSKSNGDKSHFYRE